jgi:hypothetical protein
MLKASYYYIELNLNLVHIYLKKENKVVLTTAEQPKKSREVIKWEHKLEVIHVTKPSEYHIDIDSSVFYVLV